MVFFFQMPNYSLWRGGRGKGRAGSGTSGETDGK